MKANSSLVFLTLFIILSSCSSKSEYTSLVEKEMATGIRNDSLFLGMYFGMSSEDFYQRCWELNKTGLIMEGSTNAMVKYELNELPRKGAFEFYPIFKDERIQSMTGNAYYYSWAPWNHDTFAENLIEDFKNVLEDWYGPKFISVPSPGRGKAYTKVDGNRRIVLYYTLDERIEILFTDLTNDDGILTPQEKE